MTVQHPKLQAAEGLSNEQLSHNLNGQKLGRKGRVTRERILAATSELLAEPGDTPISLSAVARRAGLGMTSLYLYFNDLTELLIAMLEPIMNADNGGFRAVLQEYWPDEQLQERCSEFLHGYHAFWVRNSRLLHLRNSMADNQDMRMVMLRVKSAQPTIALLIAQMGADPTASRSPAHAMASVLMTGIERTITVTTDAVLPNLFGEGPPRPVSETLGASARLLELAIRDMRALTKQ